jgi:hypothetical protein
MVPVNEGNPEERLDTMFRAYRDACTVPEVSANFMPELWQRIEARQRFSLFFGRVARGFVTAGVALTLCMAVFLSVPRSGSGLTAGNYVEVLAASHSDLSDLDEAIGLENSTDEL